MDRQYRKLANNGLSNLTLLFYMTDLFTGYCAAIICSIFNIESTLAA
ncbi:hypothetical protein STRMA_0029 [Streptococcus macacae NCTC 11558]|uniref:Uncharacterized protein n=1 Tax=Streptococcus macacae NCTC 11558 TaxID=764298 RepID=G5JXY4_9STRE|nr:hypothetical protein STRMA_0029 [Streptococcus macacae NCTC 11558]